MATDAEPPLCQEWKGAPLDMGASVAQIVHTNSSTSHALYQEHVRNGAKLPSL